MGRNFLLTMLTTLQLQKQHFPLISLLGTLHRDKNFFLSAYYHILQQYDINYRVFETKTH